ncbi:MAG: transcription-repair coupling factor [Rhodospirillales bacterium]|nr:transcription-repair coupling factor [Rhodospirillales bacterium]MBT4038661.1 transcription-repair coupling factor [Rhodospirillales bacterium]MBT4628513.1 transcription-repair coupling factor [Rhodospirillales bacterium]MBT5350442.1 transcription-repair coupling factor [Rhodospirillales bacterium]MBT6108628.1 transcription-repair coupling factor [Rhodospirillales bacterium]
MNGVPPGHDAFIISQWAASQGRIMVITPDDVSMVQLAATIAFFDPAMPVLRFPAWDCLPYDRVSPSGDVLDQRIRVLAKLIEDTDTSTPCVVVTTVSAALQRLVPRAGLDGRSLVITKGAEVPVDDIVTFLSRNGYVRADTVLEPGEYARRGGILDVFPAGHDTPVRMDFFGDEIDVLRLFDAETQRTTGDTDKVRIIPVSEVFLDDASISRFRSRYREEFGVTGDDDPLYESISAGRRSLGMEHWLPFFHDHLDTIMDYVGDIPIVMGHQVTEAEVSRLELIDDYYTARRDVPGGGVSTGAAPYRPVEKSMLYLDATEFEAMISGQPGAALSPFDAPESTTTGPMIDAEGRPGRDFADIRVQPEANLFDAVIDHIKEQHSAKRRVVLSAFSEGSHDRIRKVLTEHGFDGLVDVAGWQEVQSLKPQLTSLCISEFERGFVAPGIALITEQDILGERMSRPRHQRVKPENIIADAAALNVGDLVVHADHGIGQFDGLFTIEAGGAPHDCLQLTYHGDDRLFLPVENIELISRYGSEDAGAQLDRLGGAAWQARKSKLKDRIREMAAELIRVAAARALKTSAPLNPQTGIFDEFCARFPFVETEDQQRAIDAVIGDLSSGGNTDRLVCGDVGFGKTEVALRAAFVVAMEGKQVAVVVPTTLLARQHYENFVERFKGFPVEIRQLSRLVSAKDAKETKRRLEEGTVDIVIGTHALMAKDVAFRDLGLLVIDEEQHFGVAHKERLKQLKADVHVVTLSATPIPRTLQLALSGIRDLSLIATPPVDRLAVRTYVLPFDPVVIREAILRERYRGGQTFYVCPRIADLEKIEREIRELVPEITITVVNGQMPPSALEDAVTSFYDGGFDLLLATNIIESGLDMPRVNTIIIHRSDRFGLAQLYQLRGRVGRSKTRAYAYLTLPPGMKLTPAAEKRLEVMQTLDHLGAGFSLASHDLDIRGAGNLLGDEQSGHIREVGFELYQQMLEEAVAEARGLVSDDPTSDDWSPQINVGLAVLIPDYYIADLPVRMGLYRRIAKLSDRDEIDGLAAEMIDRFGPLPEETENLLQTVAIKALCREANVEKVDAGPKGAVISFRNDDFANPAGLVSLIQEHRGTVKLRPDHKLVFMRKWDDVEARLAGVRNMLKSLATVAMQTP